MATVQGRRCDQLTVTRFAAALVVVAFHFGQQTWPFDDPRFAPVLRAGPPAVTFFYVLSGFIMVTFHADLRWRDAPDYWLARIARLYPVYLLGIAATLWIGVPSSTTDLALNVLLLQAWIPGHALSVNSVGWSLSVEVFFYAVFPLLIALARRVPTSVWCLAVLAAWAGGQVLTGSYFDHAYEGFPSRSHDLIFYFPLLHLTSFALGMTAALLMRRGALRLGPRAAAMTLALSASLAVAGLDDTAAVTGWTGVHVFGATGLLAPVFALFVASLCSLNAPVLASKPLQALGQASYSLYILQFPVYIWLQPRLSAFQKQEAFWLYLAVLVPASCLVFVLVETPSRRWIRQGGAALARASHRARPARGRA